MAEGNWAGISSTTGIVIAVGTVWMFGTNIVTIALGLWNQGRPRPAAGQGEEGPTQGANDAVALTTRQTAEVERRMGEAERRVAEAERGRAEAEKGRAEAERKRADLEEKFRDLEERLARGSTRHSRQAGRKDLSTEAQEKQEGIRRPLSRASWTTRERRN